MYDRLQSTRQASVYFIRVRHKNEWVPTHLETQDVQTSALVYYRTSEDIHTKITTTDTRLQVLNTCHSGVDHGQNRWVRDHFRVHWGQVHVCQEHRETSVTIHPTWDQHQAHSRSFATPFFQVSAKSINVHSREVADVHTRSVSHVRLRFRVLKSNQEIRANKFMVHVHCWRHRRTRVYKWRIISQQVIETAFRGFAISSWFGDMIWHADWKRPGSTHSDEDENASVQSVHVKISH